MQSETAAAAREKGNKTVLLREHLLASCSGQAWKKTSRNSHNWAALPSLQSIEDRWRLRSRILSVACSLLIRASVWWVAPPHHPKQRANSYVSARWFCKLHLGPWSIVNLASRWKIVGPSEVCKPVRGPRVNRPLSFRMMWWAHSWFFLDVVCLSELLRHPPTSQMISRCLNSCIMLQKVWRANHQQNNP